MIDQVRSLAQTTIPLPWVWVMGTVLVGIVAWCVQLQAEVSNLAQSGSPTALAALQQTSQLQSRLGTMETWISHVAINDNRLTKLETEMSAMKLAVPVR
jgi:hypothetical protein